MKRNQKTITIIAFGFLLLLVATAAGSAGANPSLSNECGTTGCHDTFGTLTIASNSTSMSATTGESFVLRLDAGNGAEWIGIKTGWANNSQFSISEEMIEDGSTNDTNAASGAISVDVTFTPLSPGDLTIRVWTAASGDLASSLDIAITVTGQTITTTTTPPDSGPELYDIWIMLMIVAPVATAVLLIILGYIAIKRSA
ncbi:hypothetical protein E4H12_07510 [Candidatus Thorarchaeota archaeon]|nr:MAG: hypothetical protein E4H12_07510 [Candidatus Thorarchaeota archaeon]